ncbi:hypothetical protein B296_00053410, partial [Ensete ventricosum]
MSGRDFMNEREVMDLLNGSEYVPTYEDKDDDWMLVGDVPWEYVSVFLRELQAIDIFVIILFRFFFLQTCIADCISTWSRMFVDSCKRLRIMKGSEAVGLVMVNFEMVRNVASRGGRSGYAARAPTSTVAAQSSLEVQEVRDEAITQKAPKALGKRPAEATTHPQKKLKTFDRHKSHHGG